MNCKDCAECCGPVPVTHKELEDIKEAWRSLGTKRRKQLEQQQRRSTTCILLDTKTKRCSVYDARPLVCRMYGHYKGLQCPYNPDEAALPDKEGRKATKENGNPVGVLSITIGYEQLGK